MKAKFTAPFTLFFGVDGVLVANPTAIALSFVVVLRGIDIINDFKRPIITSMYYL